MTSHELLPLLQELHIAISDLSEEFVAEMLQIITDLGITDQDILDSSEAQLRTLANTVYLDALREEAAAAAANEDPVGYVYLGPDDAVTRPFCAELVDSWLTADEIDNLDNGEGIDAMSGGGGWNCRHQFLPLFGDQTKEYEHGSVEAANAEAA